MMTLSRTGKFFAAIVLSIPVLLFLTPVGRMTPTGVFLLFFGLSMFEPFIAIILCAMAAGMKIRGVGTSTERVELFTLGLVFGAGWLLFSFVLIGSAT